MGLFLTSYTTGTIHLIVFDVIYNEDNPGTIQVIVSDVTHNEDVRWKPGIHQRFVRAKRVNLDPNFRKRGNFLVVNDIPDSLVEQDQLETFLVDIQVRPKLFNVKWFSQLSGEFVAKPSLQDFELTIFQGDISGAS